MEKFSFYKMSGAGNDFVVIDRKNNKALALNPGLIKNLCDRRFGIGADGLITISDSNDYNFEMEYFNADGSTGSLCGNGARCAIRFAEFSGRLSNGKAVFLSNGEKYKGEVLNPENVKFNFNSPKDYKKGFSLKDCGISKADFINTGSPHVVARVEDVLKSNVEVESHFENIDDFPVFELGKKVRYHEEFSPLGTNVNFIKIENNKVYIRTYERGVEDETLACGTGSTAAALVSYYNYNLKPPVKLITKGGCELIVDFTEEGNQIKNLSLTGPAEIIFNGEFDLNKFL